MFWNFRRWKIRSFFKPRSWWKYDVYWLMKSSWFGLFRNRKYGLFWVKKLMKRWYLLITEKILFWTFRRWEIRSFFEPKSWWKDHIYWSLKSSCFELFVDGKYGLFSAKKMMERWYLLGLYEISMTFQDLGNMVSRAVWIIRFLFISSATFWLSSNHIK